LFVVGGSTEPLSSSRLALGYPRPGAAVRGFETTSSRKERVSMGSGKKRKRKKIATHKRKKRLRKNRHKKKNV
jgi:hypothetical protein